MHNRPCPRSEQAYLLVTMQPNAKVKNEINRAVAIGHTLGRREAIKVTANACCHYISCWGVGRECPRPRWHLM
ncbi:hypothetical protein NEUTE1DRAFT_118893 [Neurospora tetrasperma FGSC 2508]|uniref:Uncharacterized protein n=1 Tax=Neurospora tetrasperma (strain FGSC 2508 / ATCC MYA-4615 / P0657) TaxID=510951 RepID=F8N4G2_NEUT8|nr:uncharacterized protein NEUTE1DRAFT_118893 [Neurospora tetrasperma FGSC 2508]EGO52703.1 hypothetical protein NEUTE1DRAFT_118893 [Neurospora tetrasperma FGSC 2508]